MIQNKQINREYIYTGNTCEASKEQSTFWPLPDFCLCISAAMIAPCAYNPVVRSVTATPTLHGLPP